MKSQQSTTEVEYQSIVMWLKIGAKVPIFLNLKRVIEGGGSNKLTTMLVLYLLLGNFQILVWHPN
jgi:hypothetical protein